MGTEGAENTETAGPGGIEQARRGNTADSMARMVYAFVAAAGVFAEGMHASEELKLLRMRTRKNEVVIVPGKFQRVSVRVRLDLFP